MTQASVKVVVEKIVEPDRLYFLDGLRGWAALMVVLSHLLVFFIAHTATAYQGWYWAFPSDGNLAVFIFFVLSGFALSIGYIQTGQSSIITSLCLRRYLRLTVPILCASLLAYLLHVTHLFVNVDAGTMSGNGWLTGFYNFPPDLFTSVKFGVYDVYLNNAGAASYNPILWTMPIELFGSFVVFSICALVLHLKKRMIFLGFIFAYFVVTKNIFYLPFLCGIVIAICYHHREKTIFKRINLLLPLLILLAIYYSTTSLRGQNLPVPRIERGDFQSIAAASALVFAAAFFAPFRKFLETPVSKYLGSISFPIYLTHFFVLCSFSSAVLMYLTVEGGDPEWNAHINVATSLLLCFLIAHFFRYVEHFSIFAARRFSELMKK